MMMLQVQQELEDVQKRRLTGRTSLETPPMQTAFSGRDTSQMVSEENSFQFSALRPTMEPEKGERD
jgi:hypothetical protein